MKNPFRSLNFLLMIFVLIIMIVSSALAGGILFILAKYNIISQIGSTALLFLIIGLVVSTIIGTGLAFPVGYYFLKPLNELIEATRQVSKGNFNIKAKELKRNLGISELIKSFNIMTAELSSIEMFRTDFISNVSHEFKTPIASIQGFAELLQKNNLSKEERIEYAGIIVEESKRLSNLSSNILKISKLEHQEIIGGKASFSLDEQIRRSILLLEHLWDRKNIEFDLHLDEINYIGDEELLQQVWVNLLENAINFSKSNGKIYIGLREKEGFVECVVRDYGIGMSEATLARIFEKFYQGDKSRFQEGHGLGLPLIKRILELHEATISLESKLDEGTTFIVRLPI